MKAEKALCIFQIPANDRRCKVQLQRLLTLDCRGLIRVMMDGRPSNIASGAPITQEVANSPQTNRHSPQAPLDAAYAQSQASISEFSFSSDSDNLPGFNLSQLEMGNNSQGPKRMHQSPLQGPATPPNRPPQAQPAQHAQG